MLTLNTSQPVRLVSANESIQSQGVNLPPSASTQTIATWIDYSNKYLYIMQAMSASPWLRCDRYTYTSTGEIGSKTPMTLSGFGTFTSQPTLYSYQGSQSGNFYLSCGAAGGSANFTVDDICTVSVSGTTITKGSNLSAPTVASYTKNRFIVKGAVVYCFYGLTANPGTCDVCRKYSGSWSTLTGAALPTSVASDCGDTQSVGSFHSQNKGNTIGVGTSFDQFYNYFVGSQTTPAFLIFNSTTETWSAAPYIFTQVFPDITGMVFLYNATPTRTVMLSAAGALIGKLSGTFGSLTGTPSITYDIGNGIMNYKYDTSGISFFGYYTGSAKRIGKWLSSASGSGIFAKIDSGNWGHLFAPSTVSVPTEVNYYGATTLTFFVTMTTTSSNGYVEVTD